MIIGINQTHTMMNLGLGCFVLRKYSKLILRPKTKYIRLCVHLSINRTELSGVSGIVIKHNIQVPITIIQLNGYLVKMYFVMLIFYF